MVYIYVCKRFKVTMDMIHGRDGDWVTNLLATYCKHARLQANLERAEINPKKRMSTNCYDSSTDVFKINLVYKDTNGIEHELRWLIKVRNMSSTCHFFVIVVVVVIITTSYLLVLEVLLLSTS